MQTIRFLTLNEGKQPTLWCETNCLKMFRDFMQYVLDSCDRPGDFLLWDSKTNKVYNMEQVATEQYFMRKRSLLERLDNFQTGKWNGIDL